MCSVQCIMKKSWSIFSSTLCNTFYNISMKFSCNISQKMFCRPLRKPAEKLLKPIAESLNNILSINTKWWGKEPSSFLCRNTFRDS